jgi:hypothetical protein
VQSSSEPTNHISRVRLAGGADNAVGLHSKASAADGAREFQRSCFPVLPNSSKGFIPLIKLTLLRVAGAAVDLSSDDAFLLLIRAGAAGGHRLSWLRTLRPCRGSGTHLS